ncbi:hypothetical protein E4U59_004643 [Claviceps monticola]|nr:hypothetical protein E4U59_004643 [Claviceps monticola]
MAGNYFPRQDDFRVDLQYANSQSSDALQYWASVFERRERVSETVSSLLKAAATSSQLALDTVAIKSSHLHSPTQVKVRLQKETTHTLIR